MKISVVQRRTVKPPTALHCLNCWANFMEWMKSFKKLQVAGPILKEGVVGLLVEYIDILYLDGEVQAASRNAVAGCMFPHPSFQRPQGSSLPGATKALRGWLAAGPLKARLPMPWELTCWAAVQALTARRLDVAMALLIIFVFILRPNEARAVKCMDLVGPKGLVAFWTLVLHPFERGTPSKTGEFDETVMMKVEHFKFVVAAAGKLLKAKATNRFQALLRTSAAEVNTFLRNLVAQIKFEPALHRVHLSRDLGGLPNDLGFMGSPKRLVEMLRRL